jgi:hypothetical protein
MFLDQRLLLLGEILQWHRGVFRPTMFLVDAIDPPNTLRFPKEIKRREWRK